MMQRTGRVAVVVALPVVALLLLAPGCEHVLTNLLSGQYNRYESARIMTASVALDSAPVWVDVANAQHAARQAACPTTPAGCFASPPACAVAWCYCRAACAPAASVGRWWRQTPAECRCGP